MSGTGVRAIDRLRLVSANAAELAAFYEAAFDARVVNAAPRAGPARTTTLAIGGERIELVTFDDAGAPYPADATASDTTFQHFAIVVSDMEKAYSRLQRSGGWKPISHGGPQRLPANTGGVTAFKFRDPEGHPLELIEFPRGMMPRKWKNAEACAIALGIDHTAITAVDAAASIAFYEGLGLTVSARSINRGPEQDRLDGMDDVRVEVIALTPADTTPHIELLLYATPRIVPPAGARDIAATQIVLRADTARGPLQDPDAHRLYVASG